MKTIDILRTASLALCFLAGGRDLPLHAEPGDRAGVATAVNTTALGLPPGGSESELDVGATVVEHERIATDTAGQAQLLMLDGSSFTIGPDASVVLDEFYYDPAQGTGHAGFILAKGLMRFVGGKLSKSQAVTIDTPNGMVGIRGGIAVIDVNEAAANTHAIFLYGNEMTVTGARGDVARVTQPGYGITIARNGKPSGPELVTRAQLARITKSLSGTVGRPATAAAKLANHDVAATAVPSMPVTPPTTAPVTTVSKALATMRLPFIPLSIPVHLPLPPQVRPKLSPPFAAGGPRSELASPNPCDRVTEICG
jgi:hypothetical protein